MITVTTATLLILSTYFIYTYIVYPTCISPLRSIPAAHPTAPFSSFWILFTRYTSRENQTIHNAHLKHGPVVRLGPNEVAVNTIARGVKTIYSGNFEKHRWYDQMANFSNVPNMFATLENKPHAARKRMVSHVYSKSYLQTSKTMQEISKALVWGRLLTKLGTLITNSDGHGKSVAEVDLMRMVNAVAMDFVTAWLFGLKNSSNLLSDEKALTWWLDVFLRRKPYGFFGAELPALEGWLDWLDIKLAPNHVAVANKEIGDWVLDMCDKADANLARIKEADQAVEAADVPVVWGQLRAALTNEKRNASISTSFDGRLLAASEMWDHLAAGFETSGITLTYVFYELTRNIDIQSALRAELLTLEPSIIFTSSSSAPLQELPPPRSIDALPLLDAVLMETLRLHAAIPGPQPRITPAQGCVIGGASIEAGGYFVPGGVRVSSQAYSLHRDPHVFPDPDTWLPQRWLSGFNQTSLHNNSKDPIAEKNREENLKMMHRAFWSFSSGGRMCIGNNFATQEMKLVIAALVSNFELHKIRDRNADEAMVQEDAYTAQPLGHELRVRLKRLES